MIKFSIRLANSKLVDVGVVSGGVTCQVGDDGYFAGSDIGLLNAIANDHLLKCPEAVQLHFEVLVKPTLDPRWFGECPTHQWVSPQIKCQVLYRCLPHEWRGD